MESSVNFLVFSAVIEYLYTSNLSNISKIKDLAADLV